jgi:hypothetical protein
LWYALLNLGSVLKEEKTNKKEICLMKIKSVLLTFLSLLLLVSLLSGCAHRLGSLTAISTRNIKLDEVDLDKLSQVKNVTGTDSRFDIFIIPLGFPTLQGAVDDALTKGNGDLIIDGVVTSEVWTAILFGQRSISITGNVVNTKGGK